MELPVDPVEQPAFPSLAEDIQEVRGRSRGSSEQGQAESEFGATLDYGLLTLVKK
jgi:hypothetical protein